MTEVHQQHLEHNVLVNRRMDHNGHKGVMESGLVTMAPAKNPFRYQMRMSLSGVRSELLPLLLIGYWFQF